MGATEWLREREPDRSPGYFVSSTGAAAALRGAARVGHPVEAVVSRGGRVDLAADVLAEINVPTLFVVGGADTEVRQLNRDAYASLSCERTPHVVAGAGHLFEGEGELEDVVAVAADWFAQALD